MTASSRSMPHTHERQSRGGGAMATIIRDATIITVDPSDAVHYNAAVAVDGGFIAAVGPSDTIVAAHPGAEIIDARGKAVMPGFANIRSHFSMIIAKDVYEDLSPPNKPPFISGLAPIPLPELDSDEMRVMCRLA